MGNLCSKKRKGSDASSTARSDASGARLEGEVAGGGKRPSNGVCEEAAAALKDPTTIKQTQQPPSSIAGESMSVSSGTVVVGVTSGPTSCSSTEYSPPLEVGKQSENVVHLLCGRLPSAKLNTKVRKITIYVSAACSQDFRLEKGRLHSEVYPRLRDLCSGKGFELHIVDLHWRTQLEDNQHHMFSELAIGELKRQLEVSFVIPVLFLSNSLGAPLLPKTVEVHDFEGALKGVDGVGRSLLEKWYSVEKNCQPPCYHLKPIATHIPNILSENDGEREVAVKEWKGVVEELLQVLLTAFPNELRDTYLTTCIEQEIQNSIFMSSEVGRRSVWVQRVFTHIQNPAGGKSAEGPAEAEGTRRLDSIHNELKAQLTPEHILRLLVKWAEGGLGSDLAEHKTYLGDLTTQLETQLSTIIHELLDEEQNKIGFKSSYGVEGSLLEEIQRHAIHCQGSAKVSANIEQPLLTAKNYVTGGGTGGPLVLHGPRGSGKGGVCARLLSQMTSSDRLSVFRFARVSTSSTSLDEVIGSIATQVAILTTGRVQWTPHNFKSYWGELLRCYSSLKAPQPQLLILIDGIDQLDVADGFDWSWVCGPLPGRLKLILTVSDESPLLNTLKDICKNTPEAFVQMVGLSPSSGESLVRTSVLQFAHSMDPELLKKITATTKHSTLPLYIKAISWGSSWTKDSGCTWVEGLVDLPSALTGLLEFIEKSLDKDKVTFALGLIGVAKFGLADSELLDILAQNPAFSSTQTFLDWAPANLFLAELVQRLGPFLERCSAGGKIRIRDPSLAEATRKRYLPSKNEEKKYRQILYDYFQGSKCAKKVGRNITIKEEIGSRHLRRKLEEVPYQHFYLKGSIKAPYLTNIDWISLKLRGSTVFSFLEDIKLEMSSKSDDELSILAKTIELSTPALKYDGSQFLAQFSGRIHQGKNPVFIKTLLEMSQTGPSKISTLTPLTPFLEKEIKATTDGTESESTAGISYFDEIVRMKVGNQFAVSLSQAEKQVCVWDTLQEKKIREINSVQNPITARIVDSSRVIILCDRELFIFNLDEGTLAGKMKGVMNQKMPFFGLHENNHIVTLSRNRMYVNMMNMETGDCVTTFKVGEDRFLNSLIVSENGKYLVCGDETQKPFPLLVWDLMSRKLLYDLRIPHHEFITSLSAITKEGHYVACVCCEVDDPIPNFIVVYDLQSGTLFKKWKPGHNTLAIAITSQTSCVINALEDGRILIWDLVTGVCKYTLEKHTAPADILRLNESGSRCLSADSTGRDRSVCLWDVVNGCLLAVFTPDVSLSAIELSNDGDHITIGLRGRKELVTLKYREKGAKNIQEKLTVFGNAENEGKVTDLKSS